ncbi:MAG: alpha-hydroxy-acid oxidizing protein, partial [Bryobacterales bacterium]|nr:alpha-hydroxy-acid oxidizing protein [Bryobacterales bacterium]
MQAISLRQEWRQKRKDPGEHDGAIIPALVLDLLGMNGGERSRRRFIGWLAGSPLLFGGQAGEAIADPKEAINVFDFEEAARRALPPAHFGYLATGVDDDATLRANREGFERVYLRPRRLMDIRRVDTRTELFGTMWETPLGLAPVGNQKAFHQDGELPVARAARVKGTLQILSTAANTSVEDAAAALGRPPWYQL